jgi:hypothetical protein
MLSNPGMSTIYLSMNYLCTQSRWTENFWKYVLPVPLHLCLRVYKVCAQLKVLCKKTLLFMQWSILNANPVPTPLQAFVDTYSPQCLPLFTYRIHLLWKMLGSGFHTTNPILIGCKCSFWCFRFLKFLTVHTFLHQIAEWYSVVHRSHDQKVVGSINRLRTEV